MNYEQLAYNLKYYREQSGWTQKQLSEKMNVSRSVVTKWENGTVLPDLKSIIKLSRIFDISVDLIVGIDTPREDVLKEFNRLYNSTGEAIDEETLEIFDYLIKHPQFKQQVKQMKDLPVKKQKAIHRMIASMVEEFTRV
ncbi:helix-turn-helix domain-containing protein [Sediminibacillus halophilus]|uniref:Helix-turn-helix n=1 Tax=Sediminibacillus halophilus TaxID=482461 RepID=A0A1G9VI83_9BACI|nr:helix-turn-helix domain-containing protein [Sediminibacillus halophilus]SDM71826.1 Helix-turn-helix [Sediminibacillus halophilus]